TFMNSVKLSQANVDVAEKDLEIAKGARYPTLSVFFQYNTRYSDNATYPGFEDPNTGQYIPGGEIDFVDQLWLQDGISYGAQINIPILNGFNVNNTIKR